MTSARQRLAYALDVPNLAAAREAVTRVGGEAGVLKVGLELFVREGPPAVELARSHGAEIFLDLKLCDIPETVERAVRSAGELGVRYLTVHASGGSAMLERAARAAAAARDPMRVLAVTLLTSLDASDLAAQGIVEPAAEHVVRLAKLAWASGVRGFVASASEAARLRAELPEAFLVTPGIRPADAAVQDQKRVTTPEAAVRAGADLLVVGRPIRDAADPRAAARAIVDEIARASGERV